jgi:ABC-2 type transport system ATP-binding protein
MAEQHTPLVVDGITKRFDKKDLVLDNISLEVGSGEIFGLIGLNGVGKTTLIKIMLNLLRATSGKSSIFSLDVTEVQARKNISYLPEKFQPSRYLKGKEYLSLALSYYGKKLDIEQAREMAASLDLDPDKLDAKVGSYSKGMGQKLGLVGAFLVDNPFLILDEPMSGLDPSARIKLKHLLLKMKEQGKTIFFSSHILADIDEICDQIAIIHDKQFVFKGTPAEFRKTHKQKNLEAAFLESIGETV